MKHSSIPSSGIPSPQSNITPSSKLPVYQFCVIRSTDGGFFPYGTAWNLNTDTLPNVIMTAGHCMHESKWMREQKRQGAVFTYGILDTFGNTALCNPLYVTKPRFVNTFAFPPDFAILQAYQPYGRFKLKPIEFKPLPEAIVPEYSMFGIMKMLTSTVQSTAIPVTTSGYAGNETRQVKGKKIPQPITSHGFIVGTRFSGKAYMGFANKEGAFAPGSSGGPVTLYGTDDAIGIFTSRNHTEIPKELTFQEGTDIPDDHRNLMVIQKPEPVLAKLRELAERQDAGEDLTFTQDFRLL